MLSRSGVRQCGLLCAASIVLEKLLAEEVVDVFHAVNLLRLSRNDFVSNMVGFAYFPGSN